MLPQAQFKEQLVRVFLRPTEDEDTGKQCLKLLKKGLKQWCLKNTMKEPEVSELAAMMFEKHL